MLGKTGVPVLLTVLVCAMVFAAITTNFALISSVLNGVQPTNPQEALRLFDQHMNKDFTIQISRFGTVLSASRSDKSQYWILIKICNTPSFAFVKREILRHALASTEWKNTNQRSRLINIGGNVAPDWWDSRGNRAIDISVLNRLPHNGGVEIPYVYVFGFDSKQNLLYIWIQLDN